MRPYKKLVWLSAALILPSLQACSNGATAPIALGRVCETWEQINVRQKDKLTEATAGAIERNNVGRESVGCPYEEPVKVAVKVATK